jgi:hypothetical protein
VDDSHDAFRFLRFASEWIILFPSGTNFLSSEKPLASRIPEFYIRAFVTRLFITGKAEGFSTDRKDIPAERWVMKRVGTEVAKRGRL